MTKYLGYILAAAVLAYLLFTIWRYDGLVDRATQGWSKEMQRANTARHIQDSLYKANDSLKLVVQYHEQRVKELEQMKTPLVPNALKRNRWAGVERIGEGLTKKLP